MTIRRALITDVDKIIEHFNVVGGESNNLIIGAKDFDKTPDELQGLIKILQNSNTSAIFIGEIDGEMVCLGSLMSSTKPRIAHQANIYLSVKKSYWNIGIGTSLFTEMISFARNNGVTEIIHVGVNHINTPAINIYRKFGFVEIGRYNKYLKINNLYYDEILMNLYL